MNIEGHDNRKIYCRMLGHEIGFGYCRLGGEGQACRKIFDCWFAQFDIEKFMREHYSEEELKKIVAPSKPRITSLIEIIQQAQRDAETDEGKG